jgi:hypothetical protein
MNGHHQRLRQRGGRPVVGGGKGIAPIFVGVARKPELAGRAEEHACRRNAAERTKKLGALRHARRQPDGRERGEARNRRRNSEHETGREQTLLEHVQRLRERHLRYPGENAGLAGDGEIEHP